MSNLQDGNTEMVRILLRASSFVNTSCYLDTIQWASKYGRPEIVKLFLNDPRLDPSNDDNRAIQYASYCGHAEVVRLLLNDLRVDPSVNNNFAIRETISTVIMNMLLEKVQLPTDVDIKKYKKFLIRKKYLLKLLSTKVYDYSNLF